MKAIGALLLLFEKTNKQKKKPVYSFTEYEDVDRMTGRNKPLGLFLCVELDESLSPA